MAAASLVLMASVADMYDVVEPFKVPPSLCKSGCAEWSSLPAQARALWRDPKSEAAAGSSCAQPGAAVNAHPMGSWCYCEMGEEGPAPPASHPLANQTFLLYNTYGGQDKYISFAFTAAPPAEPAAQGWMRADYPAQTDAMPLRFVPVEGQDNTYLLQNLWPGSGGAAELRKFVGADPGSKGGGLWLHAWFDRAGALPVTVLPAELPSEVLLLAAGDGNAKGTYVSFADAGLWIRAGYPKSEAMSLKLVPSTVLPNPWDYCTSADGVPEQINVQIGGTTDSVVVSFVTFGPKPAQPPTVYAGTSAAALTTAVHGETHQHVTAAKDRVYWMHFVRLSQLKPRAQYHYKVTAGGANSTVFAFRAGYSSGATAVNIYGDMGVYTWNNMGNVAADCASGAADMVIHLGDHAYNEGESDERRGDGYMSAWQPALANCPWMPVVGNHEFYDSAQLGRFLNQTWEGWGDIAGGPGTSTATSALGALLSRGNHHGAGVHGATPSHTSRFFSADWGLIHFVALDLNVYYGNDPCGHPCRAAQKAWLAADLKAANANRAAVPFVVVMSHYPFCEPLPRHASPPAPSSASPQTVLAASANSCRPATTHRPRRSALATGMPRPPRPGSGCTAEPPPPSAAARARATPATPRSRRPPGSRSPT